jgi:hypothetical protein
MLCLVKGAESFVVHKVVTLGLPHADEGRLYLEDGGERVLHVMTDLREGEAANALRVELAKRSGRNSEYDRAILHTKDGADTNGS